MQRYPKVLKKLKYWKLVSISEVQKVAEVMPVFKKEALKGRWSRKLETIYLISTPDKLLATMKKNPISLYMDKFNIMAWSTKLLRRKVMPPKFMKVIRGWTDGKVCSH